VHGTRSAASWCSKSRSHKLGNCIGYSYVSTRLAIQLRPTNTCKAKQPVQLAYDGRGVLVES